MSTSLTKKPASGLLTPHPASVYSIRLCRDDWRMAQKSKCTWPKSWRINHLWTVLRELKRSYISVMRPNLSIQHPQKPYSIRLFQLRQARCILNVITGKCSQKPYSIRGLGRTVSHLTYKWQVIIL